MTSNLLDTDAISDVDGGLSVNEKLWRAQYKWLRDQGFQLRERFSPNWKPSWIGTKRNPDDCEDGRSLEYGQIVDAVRVSDGSRVAMKRIYTSTTPFEEDIMRYLSSEELSSDPLNHSIPLLDVLRPPDSPRIVILVVPLLREFDSPPFDTIGEAVECFRQLFEGLQFLHKNRIAHRDLNFNNFMMLADNMYPKGFHFVQPDRLPDLSGPAPFLTRTQRPPKYYIIDFGISRQYEADNPAPMEEIVIGGDKSVPEFQNVDRSRAVFNPFHTDVYYAGNLIRQKFLEGHPVLTWIAGYHGFDFLKPLINDMVQDDPSKRPTMDEVLRRYEAIVKSLSAHKLRSRPVSRRENIFIRAKKSFGHWRRKLLFIITRTPAIPSS